MPRIRDCHSLKIRAAKHAVVYRWMAEARLLSLFQVRLSTICDKTGLSRKHWCLRQATLWPKKEIGHSSARRHFISKPASILTQQAYQKLEVSTLSKPGVLGPTLDTYASAIFRDVSLQCISTVSHQFRSLYNKFPRISLVFLKTIHACLLSNSHITPNCYHALCREQHGELWTAPAQQLNTSYSCLRVQFHT